MSDKNNKLEIFSQILNKIKEYETIIIHHHVRPDGDCIGSQVGLKNILKASFPNKNIYAVSTGVPPYLEYIADFDNISDEIYKEALAIIVDTSRQDRICDERFKTAKEIIVIDHHDDSDAFGTIKYVDETCSACAGIITDFYLTFKNELVLNTKAATALFFGIITDTGRFRYQGVNQSLMSNAGFLMDSGIDVNNIYAHLYTDEKSALKLRGYVYRKFKSTPNGVVYMNFPKRVQKKLNITTEDAGNTVNELDCIKGSIIWLCFIEQPNGEIRVRLRSRFVEINDIARDFRGGGHLCAAGATIYNKKEQKDLLKRLDERLVTYLQNHPEAF